MSAPALIQETKSFTLFHTEITSLCDKDDRGCASFRCSWPFSVGRGLISRVKEVVDIEPLLSIRECIEPVCCMCLSPLHPLRITAAIPPYLTQPSSSNKLKQRSALCVHNSQADVLGRRILRSHMARQRSKHPRSQKNLFQQPMNTFIACRKKRTAQERAENQK